MTDEQYKKLSRDMEILKVENALQTIAFVLLFFFGISTLRDLKKGKK